jgi:hypothetical protein
VDLITLALNHHESLQMIGTNKELFMKYFFTLICTLTLGSAFAQSNTQLREQQAISGLETAATSLAEGDMSCTSSRQCVTLGLGSKACGGPQSYFIVSQRNFNYNDILTLANHSNSREQMYNRKYHVISTCIAIMPPKGTCVNNVCTSTLSLDK